MESSNTTTTTATATTTFSIFAQERSMQPSEQQNLVDSGGINSIQDNASPNYLNQAEKNVATMMTTTTGSFADTQTEPVGSKTPATPSPPTSSSSSSSSPTTTTHKSATIPKVSVSQPSPLLTSAVKSSASSSTTTPNSTTLSIITTHSASATSPKLPFAVKPPTSTKILILLPAKSTTTELPGKLKKTSQKSSGQQQSSMSTMVQTSIDKFTINSKKPSVSTRKVPETKFLVETTPSSTTTNTNSRKLATETAAIKPDPITTIIATTVPPKTTPTKSKPKLKTSHTSSPSPSSSASPKQTTPTASTPVKRRSLILTSTKPSPFSHARVKPTTYFELLPLPALSTVIHKPGGSPSPIKNAAVKAGPGSGVSSTSFCSAPTGSAAKTPVKIKEPMPKSKDVLTAKSNRPTPSNASSPVARNTAAITSTLIANDTMALPTKETSRRILNTNSDLKEFNSINAVIATANIRSEKSTAPTGCSTTKSSTSIKSTVAPIEISRRVIKIKSSSPTMTTPTTAPKAAEASSGAASSEVKKTSSRSKKEPPTLTETTIASQAQVSKRKSSSVPKPSTVESIKPKSKPKPSNTSSNIVDPVSSTNITTTATSVAIIVSKSKTTSKGTTTCNSSSLSTTPKVPKSTSTTTSLSTTTAPSLRDNNTMAQKPAKNLTISTAASKTKTNQKERDMPQQATATASPTRTTEDISRDSPAPFSASAPSPSLRRGSYSFNTSSSGIVLSLYTKHHHSLNLNDNYHYLNNRQFPTNTTTTTTATTNTTKTPLQPPLTPTPAPILHPQSCQTLNKDSSPRPKRLLQLMLQEDCEDCNTLHINEIDSPYYSHRPHHHHHHHRKSLHPAPNKEHCLAQNGESSRPQKRQRISDISNCVVEVAGRRYGMFGQTAFEQALAAMSFKHPLPPLPVTSIPASLTTTASSETCTRFQKRLHQGAAPTVSQYSAARTRRNSDERSSIVGGY